MSFARYPPLEIEQKAMNVMVASTTWGPWSSFCENNRPANTSTFLIHSGGRIATRSAIAWDRRRIAGPAESASPAPFRAGCSSVSVSIPERVGRPGGRHRLPIPCETGKPAAERLEPRTLGLAATELAEHAGAAHDVELVLLPGRRLELEGYGGRVHDRRRHVGPAATGTSRLRAGDLLRTDGDHLSIRPATAIQWGEQQAAVGDAESDGAAPQRALLRGGTDPLKRLAGFQCPLQVRAHERFELRHRPKRRDSGCRSGRPPAWRRAEPRRTAPGAGGRTRGGGRGRPRGGG